MVDIVEMEGVEVGDDSVAEEGISQIMDATIAPKEDRTLDQIIIISIIIIMVDRIEDLVIMQVIAVVVVTIMVIETVPVMVTRIRLEIEEDSMAMQMEEGMEIIFRV